MMALVEQAIEHELASYENEPAFECDRFCLRCPNVWACVEGAGVVVAGMGIDDITEMETI